MQFVRFARARLGSIAVCAWLMLTLSAQAQSSDESAARSAFEAGRAAYAAGDFERALTDFQRSYDLSHRPVLLYNIGMALDRLRRDEEAIDAYEHYVRAIPDAENRGAVEQRIALLRTSVEKAKAAPLAAPTPEQTARAELAQEQTAPVEAPDRPTPAPVYRKWWFWTSIGAVVAAGVVAGVVLSRSGEKKSEGPLLADSMTQVVRL